MATMASKRDYYEILGLKRDASDRNIATAYRKLAVKYHPDSYRVNAEPVELYQETAAATVRSSSPPASSACRRPAPPARAPAPSLPTHAPIVADAVTYKTAPSST